jgi:hypothetical protein
MIDLVECNTKKIYKGCPKFTAGVTDFVSSATYLPTPKYDDRNLYKWLKCSLSEYAHHQHSSCVSCILNPRHTVYMPIEVGVI